MAEHSKQRLRLSIFESVALSLVAAALAVAVTATVVRTRFENKYVVSLDPLKHELRERYGPDQFSQFGEEWIIRDFFQDRRGGIFVDVGANHHQIYNNTFYLETVLGWSGVAIDALQEFERGYKANRPNTRFVAMFASDVEDATVQFFVPENHQVSSSDATFAQRGGGTIRTREVPTTTLNAVLDAANIQKVDFLSMDIELAEPKALAGFDIGRFKPDLVCIEFSSGVRQQILDYFFKHGYVVVGKYVRVDPHNLYFQPFRK